MEPRTLRYITQACAGEQLTGAPETLASRVCTDSREVRAGDVFLALRGERFDGHSFLAEAEARHAAGAVIERSHLPVPAMNLAIIVVENTRAALGRLAARYRADFTLPAVAVAGSNGKSTTKELIAAILRQKYATLWSQASFNNDVGVPATLLQLEPRYQAAVFEVGTNHPGELAPLVAMIQPRLGVITSIGREHLEFFQDLDGVLKEEGVLGELLPSDGLLFASVSAPVAARLRERCRVPLVRVGWDAGNDWRATDVKPDDSGVAFTVQAPREDFCGSFRVNLLGRHQALNALLAVAVGAELGLTVSETRQGLSECRPLKMRLQLWEAGGVRVLDDAYNANADSVLAALQTLRELPCAGRRVVFLGDMAELGAQTEAAHAEVGRRAAELGLDRLCAVGTAASVTAAAVREAGMSDVYEFADVAEAARMAPGLVQAGDLVLLKASRVTGFERLSRALREAGPALAAGVRLKSLP